MGQFQQVTKTLSLASGATGRLWAAPSGMPVKNSTISVKTNAFMPIAQVTYEVLWGGYWTGSVKPYLSGATHAGGISQGAATALTGSGGAVTAVSNAGGGLVTIAAAGHTIANGDWVSLDATAAYDGSYEASAVVAGVSFDVVATWGATDTGTWAEYMEAFELIYEDASTHPINSPSAPPGQSAGGYPLVVEFVNNSAAALVLEVTFGNETVGTNV